jgi:serine protease AprX
MEAANVEAGKCRALAGNPAIKAQIDASRYRAIFHIWPDFEISVYINKSIATVKANAAQNAFSASGAGITWAVMDSGINSEHRHFATYANIDKNSPLHQSPSPGCRADRRVRQVSMPLPMPDRARRWTKSWSE